MLLLWLACSGVNYQRADLQWDIEAELPSQASTLRLCVAELGQRVVGARLDGRLSFVAIPAGVPVDLSLDVLDEAGDLLAQAQAQDVEGYQRSDLVVCGDSAQDCAPCQASGTLAGPGEDSWTLALRFVHEAP